MFLFYKNTATPKNLGVCSLTNQTQVYVHAPKAFASLSVRLWLCLWTAFSMKCICGLVLLMIWLCFHDGQEGEDCLTVCAYRGRNQTLCVVKHLFWDSQNVGNPQQLSNQRMGSLSEVVRFKLLIKSYYCGDIGTVYNCASRQNKIFGWQEHGLQQYFKTQFIIGF